MIRTPRSGSFAQTPAIIARVPSGDSLEFTVTPSFINEYDSDVRYEFLSGVTWTNNSDTASKTYTFTVSNSSCSN